MQSDLYRCESYIEEGLQLQVKCSVQLNLWNLSSNHWFVCITSVMWGATNMATPDGGIPCCTQATIKWDMPTCCDWATGITSVVQVLYLYIFCFHCWVLVVEKINLWPFRKGRDDRFLWYFVTNPVKWTWPGKDVRIVIC